MRFFLPSLVLGCLAAVVLAGCGSRQSSATSSRAANSGPTSNSSEHAPVPGPLASQGYVGCSSLGHTVAIRDPVGDVDTLYHPRLVAKFPSVDLTDVRIAFNRSRLCVDFTAKAPPTTRTSYIVALTTRASSRAGRFLGIDVVFWPDGAKQVVLKYPGDQGSAYRGVVPAQVGIDGDSTSILVRERAFPRSERFLRFLWSAKGVGQTGLSDPTQVSDTAPDGRPAAYP